MKKVIKKLDKDITSLTGSFVKKAEKKGMDKGKEKTLTYSVKKDFKKGIDVVTLMEYLAARTTDTLVGIGVELKGSKLLINLEMVYKGLTKKEVKIKKLLDCSNNEARYLFALIKDGLEDDSKITKDMVKSFVFYADEDGVIVSKKDIKTILTTIFKLEKEEVKVEEPVVEEEPKKEKKKDKKSKKKEKSSKKKSKKKLEEAIFGPANKVPTEDEKFVDELVEELVETPKKEDEGLSLDEIQEMINQAEEMDIDNGGLIIADGGEDVISSEHNVIDGPIEELTEVTDNTQMSNLAEQLQDLNTEKQG